MTPPNPLVATGDTLELNCTLSDPLAMGKNASSLYFEPPGDVVVNLEYVTVLDEKTISLRYPNASKSLNGHWFCRQYEATDSLNFGQQSILVAGRMFFVLFILSFVDLRVFITTTGRPCTYMKLIANKKTKKTN